jgi:hypothetical protein
VKLARRLAYGAAGLLAALVVLLLLAPMLVDTPWMRAQIQGRLSEALRGQIAWDALEVRLLPTPRGVLRGVRIEIEGIRARADEAAATLRLFPLLRGRVELDSLGLRRPEIRVETGKPEEKPGKIDPVAAYRAAAGPVVRALRAFAPDTVLRVEDAAVDLAIGGREPFELRALTAQARTGTDAVSLEASAASKLWRRLTLDARITYADLSARAAAHIEGAELAGLVPFKSGGTITGKVELTVDSAWHARVDVTQSDAWLELAALPGRITVQSAQAEIDADRINVRDARGAIGDTAIERAAAQIELGAPPRLTEASAHLNLSVPQWFAWLKTKTAALREIDEATGTLRVTLKRAAGPLDQPEKLDYEVLAVARNIGIAVRALPGRISVQSAQVEVSPRRVSVRDARGAIGETAIEHAAAQIELGATPRLTKASANLTLSVPQWFAWLKTKTAALQELDEATGILRVALKRAAGPLDQPSRIDYEVAAAPEKLRVALRALPAPLEITGGNVTARPGAVVLEDVAASMLDSGARVSGSVGLPDPGPRVQLAVSDGMLGEKLARWAVERAGAPRFEPRTPLRFAAQKLAWQPGRPLEIGATLEIESGPRAAFELAWSPQALEVRRFALKDARSDASLSARVAENDVQVKFSGVLDVDSVGSLFKQALPGTGRIDGQLEIAVDRRDPRRSTARGRLKGENFDLEWLAGRPLRVLRLDLASDASAFRIGELALEWAGQPATLRGEIRQSPEGPVVDARIESAGIDVGALLPERKSQDPGKGEKDLKLWPLPVSGRIAVQAGFVRYGEHQVAPLRGVLQLEPRRARLEVAEGLLCGLSLPLSIEIVPGRASARVNVAANDQPIEDTLRCLGQGKVEASGRGDLRADLSTQGASREEWLRNLAGKLALETRDGQVGRMDLLGRILSLRNFDDATELLQHRDGGRGLRYRRIVVQGHFERGRFLVDQGAFDSDAVRLAATGWVDLVSLQTQLTVLVALLARVDRVMSGLPVLGYVFGGSVAALPVGVSGDVRDPLIVPLGPYAVTEHLLGIFGRTLKLPLKLVEPLAPPVKSPDQ